MLKMLTYVKHFEDENRIFTSDIAYSHNVFLDYNTKKRIRRNNAKKLI